jgi:class 3 adenylate cyclase/predicted ATPase
VDVAVWLQELGLEQYERAFRDNDIDREVLPKLTAEDLTGLGVISIGHRRKLLAAAAALREGASPVEPPPAERRLAAPAVSEAERRRLTVMFVDLVGSTELSARLDPEEMNEVLRLYRTTVAAEIAWFEGHVAKLMGDGVLAYFGWPRAHEDEAERAVRAGLAVATAVGGLRTPAGERIAARVGIATGLVMVGELIGEGVARERSVVGGTPNLAARLQGLAAPGGVVVAAATRRLLGDLFELQDLGTRPVKGLAEPVPAFAVSRERVSASRFEAHGGLAVLPMEGRDQELALLLERWSLAKTGAGQGVLLVGEAGIGKSRITRALIDAVAAEPHVRVRLQCSPYHTDSALWPVVDHLRHTAGFAADDSRSDQLDKLEAVVRQGSGDIAGTVPLFAELLGLETEGRYGRIELTPQARRARTLKALSDELVALAAREPVLLILEDAHWLDPSTLEVIELYLDRGAAARILTVITSRPDRQPALAAHPHVTRLTLNRLGRAGVEAIVASLSGDEALPAGVMDAIVSRTDGVPLFVEEITKAVLETGAAGELRVPASLHDSLMARLDRLPEVKEVAQAAACIGRVFDYPLLAAVAGWPEGDLAAALGKLAAAELVFRRGTPPEASYTFKHALVRDAAYESLLRSRRQAMHREIAEALTERFPDVAARTPELLARHYGEAGLDDRAKHYWTLAGRQALAGSKYAEASSHLANALALAREAPPSGERVREEAQLLLDQAQAIVALKGPGSVDTGRIAAEAVGVSEPLGDDLLHFRARWADWIFKSMSGDLPTASSRADQLVAMADRAGAAEMRLQAHHARWTTAFLRGQVAVTRDDVEHGLALYDFDQHREHLAIYGAHDPGVCAHGTGACALLQAGFAGRAAGMAREAVRLGRDLGHPYSQALASWYAGFFSIMVGDAEGARAHAEALADVAEQNAFALPARLARIIGGWAETRLGEPGRGADRMEAAYRELLEAKQRAYLTFLGTLVAGARLETGRVERALSFLDEVRRLSVETHQQMFMPELHRLRAEALRRLGSEDRRIEEEYWQALRLADQQGAPTLELRAATGLASWFAGTNRHEQGRDLLRSVHGRFAEGFEMPDLDDAKAVLTTLQ